VTEFDFSMIIAGVVAGAAPIVLAAIGRRHEKSGLINLRSTVHIAAAMVSFVALSRQAAFGGFRRRSPGRRGGCCRRGRVSISCCNTRWP